MKNKTFEKRVGRSLRNIYLVPYRSRSGNFAGTHRIGTDENGQPKYKYLRLKHFNSLSEFLSYYGIVPLRSWKSFTQASSGKLTCQSLRATINSFSSAAMENYQVSKANSASSRAKDNEISSLKSEVASFKADKKNSANQSLNSETSSASENQPNPDEPEKSSESSVSTSSEADNPVTSSSESTKPEANKSTSPSSSSSESNSSVDFVTDSSSVSSESDNQVDLSEEPTEPSESSEVPSSNSETNDDDGGGLDLNSLAKSSESVERSIKAGRRAKVAQQLSDDNQEPKPNDDVTDNQPTDDNEQPTSGYDFQQASRQYNEQNNPAVNQDGSINHGAWNDN